MKVHLIKRKNPPGKMLVTNFGVIEKYIDRDEPGMKENYRHVIQNISKAEYEKLAAAEGFH